MKNTRTLALEVVDVECMPALVAFALITALRIWAYCEPVAPEGRVHQHE